MIAQVAVRAIQAGADMLLMSPDLPHAYQSILARVRTDRLFRTQVQAADQRVLGAKARAAITPGSGQSC